MTSGRPPITSEFGQIWVIKNNPCPRNVNSCFETSLQSNEIFSDNDRLTTNAKVLGHIITPAQFKSNGQTARLLKRPQLTSGPPHCWFPRSFGNWYVVSHFKQSQRRFQTNGLVLLNQCLCNLFSLDMSSWMPFPIIHHSLVTNNHRRIHCLIDEGKRRKASGWLELS